MGGGVLGGGGFVFCFAICHIHTFVSHTFVTDMFFVLVFC